MAASTIKICLFFLAAGLPLLINPFALNSVELIKRQSAYVLVGLLAVCALVQAIRKNPVRLYALPVSVALLVFGISACIATVFSINLQFSLLGDPCRGESFFTLITYVALTWCFAFFIQTLEQARDLIRALCITAALIALYGIIEFLCLQAFGISPLQHVRPPVLRQPFISATMGNANFLGRFLVLVLPLFAAGAASAANTRQILLWAGGGVLACTTLVLTYSRASLIGAAVAGGVFAIITRQNRRIRWLMARLTVTGIAVIVLIGLISSTLSGFGPRSFFSTIASRANSALDMRQGDGLATRLFTWQRSIPVILERPFFGHGPDTGFNALKQVNFEKVVRFNTIAILDRIHNNYLDIALTQGLVGLGAYLALLIMFMRSLLKKIRTPDTAPEARMLLCGLFSGFAGCMVNDVFTFSTVSVSMTFWSLIGIGCAIQRFTTHEINGHGS